MNKENLQRMADHIRTVPQEMFNMYDYRIGDESTPECGSVGCVIGHCTILDAENVMKKYINPWKIFFAAWSEDFTRIDYDSDEWEWCFGSAWHDVDNTPEGAALRIEWFIKNGLPEDWWRQMLGSAKLCYR